MDNFNSEDTSQLEGPSRPVGHDLVQFVMGYVDDWRKDFEANYHPKWNQLERLNDGKWAAQDKERNSERSKIVTPGLQQAIEAYCSDMSEAVFGSGTFFDLEDDNSRPIGENASEEIQNTRKFLSKEFKKTKARKTIEGVIMNGAIMDVGFCELEVKKVKEVVPAEKKQAGDVTAVGVNTVERIRVVPKILDSRSVFFDVSAASLDESIGVAVRVDTPLHIIEEAISKNEYADVSVVVDNPQNELSGENEPDRFKPSTAKITKWFGKVPRELLTQASKELKGEAEEASTATRLEDVVAPIGDLRKGIHRDMVEAVVVIVNDTTLLKATENPWMMKDRPIIGFSPEPKPGKIIGKGVGTKGFNMQIASDTSVRMHIDAQGYVAAPVFAMDSLRLPKGMNFQIYPGRNIKVTGPPTDFIQRLDLGSVDPVMLESNRLFERMLLQATGTLDTAGNVAGENGEQKGAQLAINLAGLIKRHKRALTACQEDFIIPLIQKTAWRYMQFAPNDIKSQDYSFIPMGTLGMVAREYEQQMLLAMLSTLGPESPIVPLVLAAVLEMSSLRDRDTLVTQLRQLSQKTPEQEEIEKAQAVISKRLAELEVADKASKVDKTKAETHQIYVETQLAPKETAAKLISASTNNLPNEDVDDKLFRQRLESTDRLLKLRELEIQEEDTRSNERIALAQMSKKGSE